MVAAAIPGRMNKSILNAAFNDYFAYHMSQYDFFRYSEGFLKAFPERFTKYVNDYPDLLSLDFIRNLQFMKAGKYTGGINKIQFISQGKLSNNMRNKIMKQ
jgi:hypothetical protein